MRGGNQIYDVIVIGVGSMGSAACYNLASRGVKVLGLEQFEVVHNRGSHTGQTRIIRKAYYEHPDYVPLLERSYRLWKEIEVIAHEKLFISTGILYLGEPDHPVLTGIKRAAGENNIKLELKPAGSSSNRYHGMNIPAGFESIFEPDAGFVYPEKTIHAFYAAAIDRGAVIHDRENVLGWQNKNECFEVQTELGIYKADKLVFTAGAWTSKLLGNSSPDLRVTRQLLAWVKPENVSDFLPENFPCWFIADPQYGLLYGFPFLDEKIPGSIPGIKIARHHPSATVNPDIEEHAPDAEELEILRTCLMRYFPEVSADYIQTKNCLYTNSIDEDFIIDFLPGYDKNIVMACGFSGHGFKFVPVVGEILADLAIEKHTELPIGFLSLGRFPK